MYFITLFTAGTVALNVLSFKSTEPGKARPGAGAWFGFGHEAIHVKQYEVLIGDPRAIRWVPVEGTFSFDKLGARPVEGGREDDGTPLVIARAHAKERSGILGIGGGGQEGLFPGKASPKLSGAYVTVGDKEVKVEVSVRCCSDSRCSFFFGMLTIE